MHYKKRYLVTRINTVNFEFTALNKTICQQEDKPPYMSLVLLEVFFPVEVFPWCLFGGRLRVFVRHLEAEAVRIKLN